MKISTNFVVISRFISVIVPKDLPGPSCKKITFLFKSTQLVDKNFKHTICGYFGSGVSDLKDFIELVLKSNTCGLFGIAVL